MSFAVCCVPVSALRMDPTHKSEMVTQLLFGEVCTILEVVKGQWARVKCRYDGYEGWCPYGQLILIAENVLKEEETSLTGDWCNEVLYNSQIMIVPMGCPLAVSPEGTASWNNTQLQYKGNLWQATGSKRDEERIRKIAFKYLNTAYLWGGKSNFGIDCSGYAQMVYRFLRIPLARDAYQQAEQGEVVGFLQEALCGDLAFFDNEEGRITHVGILLNDHEIIHASVKVRVDPIDNLGIVNKDTFARTHNLRIIKRYFQ